MGFQLSIEQLYESANRVQQPFPKTAVREMIRRKDETIPFLLNELTKFKETGFAQMEEDDFIGHFLCFFILAQFRVSEALPYFLDLLRLSEDRLDPILGDALTEDGAKIIASLYDGNRGALVDLIRDESVFIYARGECIRALSLAVLHGAEDIDAIVELFRDFLHPERGLGSPLLNANVCMSCDIISSPLLLDEIRKAFDAGLVDTDLVDSDYVAECAGKNQDTLFFEALEERWNLLIDDAIGELAWWDCFKTDEDRDRAAETRFDDDYDLASDPDQVVREGPKIGRNDPCPCGSGLKYKRCCGK